ncbi:MAG: hypothetical protein QNJ57_12630 [Flavobacteriaceae bacterium]|nr:hypothetical protein [Flavobacteriaceae bacterium]
MKRNYLLIAFLLATYTINSQKITTIAGNGKTGFSGDGDKATNARLNLPFNLTLDQDQNIYIADTHNNSVRRVDAKTGVITTVVRDEDKFSVDALKDPTGIAVDKDKNLYIAELSNLRIRRVNVESGSAMTLVGKKSETEQPNIDSDLSGPFNMVFDKDGNMYVSVVGESRIRRVDFITGEISDFAGTGEAGFSGDGNNANRVQLNSPTGLAIDSKGNLFISDSGNERVRKINLATGIISTVAGTGRTGFSGEGLAASKAKLSNPLGLAVDKEDNLYVVDRGNNRIRKIDAESGLITTVVGTGKSGFSGDGGLAKNARLSNPTGIAFDASDNLYIVDRGNNRIRMVSGLFDY